METIKIGILEGNNFSLQAIEKLSEWGTISIFEPCMCLESFLYDKEVLFIRLAYKIDSDFLVKCKKLKYLCSPTTGLNHIDMNETEKHQIKVISLRDELNFLSTIRATPEHIVGLTLSLLRNYSGAFITDESQWNRDNYIGEELYCNKVGIIGYGRVGKLITKYFRSFEAEVYAYDIDKEKYDEHIVESNSIDELINQCNIIILAASHNKENTRLIDHNLIDRMKNKYFINAARGELVEEGYLLEKIQENHFKGIAIDVVSNETCNTDYKSKLLKEVKRKHRNLVVTPHIGGATLTSMNKTEDFIVEKLIELIGK